MGVRFRKSFKLFSGLKLNISKKGISTSFGGKGFSINTGTHGTFINSGLPGTGISYRSKLFKKGRRTHSQSNSQHVNGGLLLGIIIGACVFLWSGSFMLSFLPVIIVPFLVKLGELEENTRTSTKHTQTEEEHMQAIKRKERAQQQLQITIIKPKKHKKEKQQATDTKKEKKLLQLLEVDKI